MEDAADQGLAVGMADLGNEGLIDLEDVDGQLGEQAQGAEAGAEVIQCDPDTECPYLSQHGQCHIQVLYYGRFSDFEAELLRGEIQLGQEGLEVGEELFGGEL